MGERPTIVLVHGAWGRPEMWDGVAEPLRREGWHVSCADLPTMRRPSATLADDVHHVLGLIGDGPAVLCGHSYGGASITEVAATSDQVAHLVYLAATMPDVGESMFDVMSRRPLSTLTLDFSDDGTSTPQIWGADDGRYRPDALALFAANPPRPFAIAAAVTPLTAAGWHSTPTTYIVAGRDQVLHPDTQRELAGQTERVIELDCDHMAMFVHPVEIAAAVAEAATS